MTQIQKPVAPERADCDQCTMPSEAQALRAGLDAAARGEQHWTGAMSRLDRRGDRTDGADRAAPEDDRLLVEGGPQGCVPARHYLRCEAGGASSAGAAAEGRRSLSTPPAASRACPGAHAPQLLQLELWNASEQ